ncbi:hypothetical protein GRF59_21170 [Paenibacillus sp. HJL G12]|uniref:Lipid/polyisoprenoid-binding YceI-like domain-containing protein n=1 Tax=Paenibacillus dendrobii TaxID=2691084 RepID=A0A7X3IMF9_9BACL|nr:YceI family protein [Paenibacillus dendrobii]MWV46136.1 hypothetical protein [Paenibacillus dendrobii]
MTNTNTILWEVDPQHSSVEFSVKHLMINKIKGVFERFQAQMSFDPNALENMAIEASIDASSITTRQPQRDEHLKSDDFLDSTKYPDITFQGLRCEPAAEGRYDISGNLTMHGTTKPVIFHTAFEGMNHDPRGRQRAGFHAIARIDRSEFGLTFNSPLETGGVVVGNEITIELNLEAIRIE